MNKPSTASLFLPWTIVHVAVRERLPDLHGEVGVGGLFVVFWCDRVPLGQLSIPASLLPVTSSQLAATVPPVIARAVGNRVLNTGFRTALPVRSRRRQPREPLELTPVLELGRPLESLSRVRVPDTSEPGEAIVPSVSVVICTRNRPEALKRCLSSLRSLTPRPNEIVVVDNDPSSGRTQAVTAAFPDVRCVPESRAGLSAARNTGVRTCSGAIIAFTDDDVVVHAGWIDAMRVAFRDPGVIAMTGLVLPAELATRAQYVFQRDAMHWGYRAVDFDQAFFRSTRRKGVPAWRVGAGANMAFRREAFERVGLFDERLGAGSSGCSEDSELWYRLLAEGHRCRYEPAAVIFHYHRSDWKELCEQMYSYMRGHVAALLFQFDRYRHWGNIYRAFLALPYYFARLAFRSLRRTAGRLMFDSNEDFLSLPLGQQIRGALAGYVYYVRCRCVGARPMTPTAASAGRFTPAAAGRNDGE